jgi:ribosomal protein S12 methylthiotransferase
VTQNKSICVTTLGCVKNLVDSEKLLGGLRPYGFRVTEDPNNTDILVINTCGFIQTAIDENADYIRQDAIPKDIRMISKKNIPFSMVFMVLISSRNLSKT